MVGGRLCGLCCVYVWRWFGREWDVGLGSGSNFGNVFGVVWVLRKRYVGRKWLFWGEIRLSVVG